MQGNIVIRELSDDHDVYLMSPRMRANLIQQWSGNAKGNPYEGGQHHDNAAKAHRTAAEHHGKGEHDKGHEELVKAHEHSSAAHRHSTDAHGKSGEVEQRNSPHSPGQRCPAFRAELFADS